MKNNTFYSIHNGHKAFSLREVFGKVWLLFWSAFLSIFVFDCSNSFLEEADRSLISPSEFFMEDRDAQSAVDAIYSHFNGDSFYAKYYWLIGALASDEGFAAGNNPDLSEFSDFELTPYNQVVATIWSELYAAIHTTNFAIQNIPETRLSENEKKALIGEAKFFRGLFYFDLVRFFGAVPLDTLSNINLEDDYTRSRTPVEGVYDQIEIDFTAAFESLSNLTSPGRPTRLSALAYLAKLSMIKGEFSRAFQINRIIINTSIHSLLPDYAETFKIGNNNSAEYLFSINFSSSFGGPMNEMTLPRSLGGKPMGRPSTILLNSFEQNGLRREVTLNDFAGDTHVTKFWDESAEPLGGRTANDLPLVRYADVLLMQAETINEIRKGTNSEALAAINAVRRRARMLNGMEQGILPDLGPMRYDAFKEAILLERMREFAFEGHRWFDLIRADQLREKVMAAKPGVSPQEKHYLFPIPQEELDKNPLLTQNPGY